MRKFLCLLSFLSMSLVYAEDVKTFVYDDHGKRDPFGPLISSSGTVISADSTITATDMNLEGVVIDKAGHNLAIINGKIVKVKDQVGTYTVAAIFNDHVDLVKGQENLSVRLKKGGL
ncbi:MAG: hypothetical protein HQL15_01080 [Candidatus Omnitrophica bacterium]|nr:hypothetical protein [Candidatus Omnitrophota bacterium]